MIRAGRVVCFEALPDQRVIARDDERVDQAVTALAGHVLLGEAEPLQVRCVVRQAQVGPHRRAAGRPGTGRVGFQHDPLLGREELARAENLAGQARVLGRDQVGMGASGAGPGQPQHPRPKRRQDQPLGRHALGVEHVKVVNQGLVRRAVPGGGLGMSYPHAKQEPAGVGGLDAVVRASDLVGLGPPDVDDAGRHRDGARRLQDRLDV